MIRTSLRSPDALSNPYLAYALLIYAGLYGIENKLGLPGEAQEGSLLPQSLKEAKAAASSSSFVADHIPEQIIKRYCR